MNIRNRTFKNLAILLILGIAFFLISDAYLESDEQVYKTQPIIAFDDLFEDTTDLKYLFKNFRDTIVEAELLFSSISVAIQYSFLLVLHDSNAPSITDLRFIIWSRANFA